MCAQSVLWQRRAPYAPPWCVSLLTASPSLSPVPPSLRRSPRGGGAGACTPGRAGSAPSCQPAPPGLAHGAHRAPHGQGGLVLGLLCQSACMIAVFEDARFQHSTASILQLSPTTTIPPFLLPIFPLSHSLCACPFALLPYAPSVPSPFLPSPLPSSSLPSPLLIYAGIHEPDERVQCDSCIPAYPAGHPSSAVRSHTQHFRALQRHTTHQVSWLF